MSHIEEWLRRYYETDRIVFWYDETGEMRGDYEELELEGVAKAEIANNELALKHRLLRLEPAQRFLLYHEGLRPDDEENWLLDLLLAHRQFRADKLGLWMEELGLDPALTECAGRYMAFLQSRKRRDRLRRLLTDSETERSLPVKMLAVCIGVEPRPEELALGLLEELAEDGGDAAACIERCGLWEPLWTLLEERYGYRSEEPGLKDFVLQLFDGGYRMTLGEESALAPDALVFLKHWKDSMRSRESFEALSGMAAEELAIPRRLQGRHYRELQDLDLFEEVDRCLLAALIDEVERETVTAAACSEVVRARRVGHWFEPYRHLYGAVEAASAFFQTLHQADLAVEGLAGGVRRYSGEWYQVDQLYRRFWAELHKSGERSMLQEVALMVERRYVERFLLPLNEAWQSVLDGLGRWGEGVDALQRRFFAQWVQPHLSRKHKIVVVVSDALRYEAAEELRRAILREKRYEAELSPMLGALPSYTQMGMAALLPHRELELADDEGVTVDGWGSRGSGAREQILQREVGSVGRTVRYDDFMACNRDQARELIRESRVLYVYHNRIDLVGDHRESEVDLPEAVDAAVEELVRLLKKLANANASHMLVTSDHGFLYREEALQESDFIEVEAGEGAATVRERRFLYGPGPLPEQGLWGLPLEALGLAGEGELRMARSVRRLRVKGAGSRFVHGGASPQEVVVPVLHVRKTRAGEVEQVAVSVDRSEGEPITTGQLAVRFFQNEPVTAARGPRRLRAGVYAPSGELISDEREIDFDQTSPEPRDREWKVAFLLTQGAEAYNGQTVTLRIDERIPGTAQYREYHSVGCILRRTFTTDF